MKIFYITYDGVLDPVSQSQVIPYLQGLRKKGFEIFLLSFEKKENLKDKNRIFNNSEKFKNNKIIWYRKIYHKSPAVPATIFDILQGVIEGFLIIKKNKINIIHSRGYIAESIGFILKKLFRVKIIFDMRGFWPDEKVDGGFWPKNSLIYKFWKGMEKLFIKNSDSIIVLTESARKAIKDKYNFKNNLGVIPCCVDLGLFNRDAECAKIRKETPGFSTEGGSASGRSPERFIPEVSRFTAKRHILIYAGSLGSFYSLDKILIFFNFFRKYYNDAMLKIVSNYPKDIIEKIALQKKIKKNELIIQNLSYSEMPKAFCEAAFSLIFYKRALSNIGCSPIKFAESLASGIPVIADSGIGDCDEIIEKNRIGVIIRDFSEKELKSCLDRIDILLKEKEELAKRCRRVSEELFSLEEGILKYGEIYSQLK